MRRRERGRPRGFTLIELLVVVAIIAALMALMVPVLAKVRGEAHKASCASNLRQIGIAFGTYGNAHDGFYPCAQDPVSTSPFYWLWMGRGWRGLVEPFFGQKIDPENPSVLLCKADAQAEEKYEATSYAYSMCFYHTPRQIDAMTSYKDTYSGPRPSIGQRAGGVGEPDHKVLAGEWTSNHRRVEGDNGWWNWNGSRNYLFADGHTLYLNARQVRPANDENPNPCLTERGIKGRDVD